MLIEIFSDAVCPWCYLGKRRFERALAQRPDLDVQVRWLPFELNSAMPEGGLPRQQYLSEKFGDPKVLVDSQVRLTALGREIGIDYQFERIALSANTRAAHALGLIAEQAGCQDAVQEAVFRAYFEEGRDIGSLDALVAIAGAAGLDEVTVRKRLASRADYAAVEQLERQGQAAGVSGVPFFVFNRKYALSGAQDEATFLKVLDHVAGLPDG